MIGTRVAASVTQLVLLLGERSGTARRDLLEAASLTEEDLLDRDAYVPFDRQVALARAIVSRPGGRGVAVRALRSYRPQNLGLLGDVMRHRRTLGEAFATFAEFQALLTDGVRWTLQGDDPRRFVVEIDSRLEALEEPPVLMAGLLVAIGRQLTESFWRPVEVRLRQRGYPLAAELASLLSAPVRFGCESNELLVPGEALKLPIRSASLGLFASLQHVARERLALLAAPGDFGSRAHRTLYGLVLEGRPARERLAKALGVSTRTLNRRLSESGSTYQALLDRVRRELAELWLSDGRNSVADVAFLLGYTEPSTFHRAFLRWTGCSASQWRAGLPGPVRLAGLP
jgi:AraC-like DNA-binding protein